MNYKWIGTLLIMLGCGGTGISIVAAYRKEEAMLTQLRSGILYMKSQLEYRLTPLPQLCRQTARQSSGPVRSVFEKLAAELEQQLFPEAADCMCAALASHPELPSSVRTILRGLGKSLGQMDLIGQLRGMELAEQACQHKQKHLEENRDQRLRSYQTLSFCAGAALAVLLF